MTSNPMTNERVYEGAVLTDSPMTISGAVNKTLGLLCITVLTACYSWYLAVTGFGDKLNALMMVGAIAGFILALIAAFKPQHSKILGIGYAACEGLVLGGISAIFNAAYPGIVVQAVLGTFLSMFVVLALFKARVIRATETFRSVILASTIAIAVFYLAGLLLNLFHIEALNGILYSNSPVSIGISAVVIVIASLNLILDFDFIEKGAQNMAPKYFEWYGALSLLVTLVWLYLEILRLLAKVNSRK